MFGGFKYSTLPYNLIFVLVGECVNPSFGISTLFFGKKRAEWQKKQLV